MGLYRILSIDGGGIRGIIPAALLAEIEKRTGRPVCLLFDLIAGTSTGGILAAGLAAPGSPDPDSDAIKPRFSAVDLLELYEKRGKDIFARSLWERVSSVEGLADEKYPSKNIEEVLGEYFADIQLKDVLVDTLVTSYEIEERKPYFFKSTKARSDPERRNHFLRDLARATSAAPTYFEPVAISTVGEKNTRYLVDGGVFAHSPALCAYAEAISAGELRGDILVASLGTGAGTRPIDYDKAKDWGKIRWARPAIDIMMDGVADSVDYQLRQVLPKNRYYRFNCCLREALDDLDATNRANLNALKREAEKIIGENTEEFQELCDALAE